MLRPILNKKLCKENMMKFEQAVQGIYRLKVPFEDLYTSVFLIKASDCNVLIDCATTHSDVDEIIVPALQEIGTPLSEINYLVITHDHGDHSGGKMKIRFSNRNIRIVTSLEKISNDLELISMTGHSDDGIGVLDLRTGTLISGDAIQGEGIGKYRFGITNLVDYVKTINMVKADKRVQNILFSHAFEPWNNDSAIGRKEVEKRLKDCIKVLSKR